MIGEVVLAFGAPVVGQLQQPLLAESPHRTLTRLFRHLVTRFELGQEVERKAHLFEVESAHNLHTEHAGVERQRFFRVLDSQHAVIETKTLRFSRWCLHTGVLLSGKTHACSPSAGAWGPMMRIFMTFFQLPPRYALAVLAHSFRSEEHTSEL